MKNSDLLLFFFIVYDFIITFIFTKFYLKYHKELKELDKYNEELTLELAKIRRK